MFVVVGLDFHKSDLSTREHFSISPDELPKVYRELKKQFDQTVILSTCNRMEIYFKGYEDKTIAKDMIAWLTHYCNYSEEGVEKKFYSFFGNHAIVHLFEVAAGLHSMVIGENQILSQIKNAYDAAHQHVELQPLFNKLFQTALTVGKQVRTDTKIGHGGMSLGSISVDLIKKLHEKNSSFSVGLIGAGEIAEEVLKSLAHHGQVKVMICNRDQEKAKLLQQKYQDSFSTSSIPFEQRYEMVAEVDVTIVLTNSKDFLIKKAELEEALQSRNRFSFFIDLSVPRNIDPSIEEIGDLVVYSLDDLYKIIQKNQEERMEQVEGCKEIIYEAMEKLTQWHSKKTFYLLKKEWDQFFEQINQEKKLSNQPLIADQIYEIFLKKFYQDFFEMGDINSSNFSQEKIDALLKKNFLVESLQSINIKHLGKEQI